jgi:chaperonin GroES
MKLKPMHDWAVIRISDAAEKTAGGLYIPDSAKEKPQEGVVESIGPGAYEEEKYGAKKVEKKDRRFIPATVKPGDLVLYERYAGKTYTIDGEELVLVREREILGILSGAGRTPLQIPAATSSKEATAIVAKDKPKKTALKTAAPSKAKKTPVKKTGKKK